MCGVPKTCMVNCFNCHPVFQIDSIKWYKDGGEFYRVHPRLEGREDVRQFSVSGVQVDTNNTGLTQSGQDSWQHSVNIVNTKLATSGTFRCQITEATAPFHTEQQDRNITVISKSQPLITKGKAHLKDIRPEFCQGESNEPTP